MLSINNIIGKKACKVDPVRRMVEVVNKKFKVTIEFLNDGRAEVTCFNEDGSKAENYCLA